MDITDWNNDEILRLIMAKGRIKQKNLLALLKSNISQEIPQSTFSCKIKRNGLKLIEIQQICKILGYKLVIEPCEKLSR